MADVERNLPQAAHALTQTAGSLVELAAEDGKIGPVVGIAIPQVYFPFPLPLSCLVASQVLASGVHGGNIRLDVKSSNL